MALEKILTNKKRWRKWLTYNADCPRCNQGEESVLHVIRDCKWAREVWPCLIPAELKDEFFSMELRPWLMWVVKKGKEMIE